MTMVSTLPLVNPAMLNFGVATPVITAAQKFVVPVPAFVGGGQPLVYPSGLPNAGQPITDWEGKPIGESGVVFLNEKDQAYQAAPGDGTAVVIMNGVGEETAGKLHEMYGRLGNPEGVSHSSFSRFLEEAREVLGIRDMYNSDRGFIRKHMTPVQAGRWAIEAFKEVFGHMKRDARDISTAIYVKGGFQFQGPAATPQVFEEEGVVVKLPNSETYGIQVAEFLRDYRLAANGQPVKNIAEEISAMGIEHLLGQGS